METQMNTDEALQRLKSGDSVDCVTPDGKQFQIQSKVDYGVAWYRARPVRRTMVGVGRGKILSEWRGVREGESEQLFKRSQTKLFRTGIQIGHISTTGATIACVLSQPRLRIGPVVRSLRGTRK